MGRGWGGLAPPPIILTGTFGQWPRSSHCSSVQCVHFGSIKRENYFFMASTKKNHALRRLKMLFQRLHISILRESMPLDPASSSHLSCSWLATALLLLSTLITCNITLRNGACRSVSPAQSRVPWLFAHSQREPTHVASFDSRLKC